MGFLLDINSTMFTVLDYPMSYVEFFGTVFNLWSVWLVARNNILTWPVGLVGVVLFGILFYQIQLYSDLLEQVYYLGTGCYGWWLWHRVRSPGSDSGKPERPAITHNTVNANLLAVAIVIDGTLGMGMVMARVHLMVPQFFPEPASFPYLDALTTAMSFAAQFLMAHRRLESWYLWIAVDVVGIALYTVKGVLLIAALYVVFLGLAIKGLLNWRRIFQDSGAYEGA